MAGGIHGPDDTLRLGFRQVEAAGLALPFHHGLVFFFRLGGVGECAPAFVQGRETDLYLFVPVDDQPIHVHWIAVCIRGLEGHPAGQSLHGLSAFRIEGQVELLLFLLPLAQSQIFVDGIRADLLLCVVAWCVRLFKYG